MRRAGVLIILVAVAACGRGSPDEGLGTTGPAIPEVDLTHLPASIRDDALEAQARALASPDDPEAVGRLGMHYYANDYPLAAADCMKRAARLAPAELRWWYYLGLAYEKAGESPRAIEALEHALEVDPGYGPVAVALADLLRESDPDRSRSLYERALRLDPDDPIAHFGLGHHARTWGRPDEALAHFRRAVQIAPDYAEAHYAIAMMLAGSSRPEDREEMKEHLREHAAGGPAPMSHDPLRLALMRIGDPYADLQMEAERLVETGKLDDAADLLERAITDDSGKVEHKQLGVILGQQGRFEEAAEQFRLALQKDPDYLEAKSYLGLALERLGRPEEAESLYRETLDRDPQHARTLVQLGRLLWSDGRRKEAVELLRRGVQAQPAQGDYQFSLAIRLAQMGKDDEAIQHMRKAVLLMPDNAAARRALDELLARAGPDS